MQRGLFVLCLSLACGAGHAVAQDVRRPAALSGACAEFNWTIVNYLAGGRLEDADHALSDALSGNTNGFVPSCAWVSLYDVAVAMASSGRLAKAEEYVGRSLRILESSYPPDDRILLRPIRVLWSVQFEQGEIAKARKSFQRMLSIRAESPADRVLVHGAAAGMLHLESRFDEAEPEYLLALAALEESGAGRSADASALLTCLGTLYSAGGRYSDAARTLDHALDIVTSVKDSTPIDYIRLFNTRAALHVRRAEWREAEADLGSAIATADGSPLMDPHELQVVLNNYAYVLRKNHRGKEVRSIKARAAALTRTESRAAVVDVTQLLQEKTTHKR